MVNVRPTPSMVITTEAPRKRYLLWIMLALGVCLGGWKLYQYGFDKAGYDFKSFRDEHFQLAERVGELEKQNTALSESNAALKQSASIERHAYEEVDDSLQSMQMEILELKEEVAFYRSIVAPRESSRGLRIQRFKVDKASQPNTYRYKLVLTQVIKSSSMARGQVSVNIEGLEKGAKKRYALAELSADKDLNLGFKFKYFQSFEGDIVLPKGFVPTRVEVKVSASRTQLEKTYDWPRFKPTA